MLLCVQYTVAHMLDLPFEENKTSVNFPWKGDNRNVRRTYFDKNSIRYESIHTIKKYTLNYATMATE